jgi:aryl-alcohol dehydrogenase-like predicted oxidoreductase
MRHAFELGIAHFDTAHVYGHGIANQIIAEALGSRRDELVIATKAGILSAPGGSTAFTIAQQPHQLRAAVEADLSTLKTDRLDVVYLRRMDYGPGLAAEGDQLVPLDDQLAEMVSLRDAGKIRAIGLSQVTAYQFHAAIPAGIACVSNPYHVLDRRFEPLLNECRQEGIAWVPFHPRGGWALTTGVPKVSENPTVCAIADRLGVTPSQIALAWQLAHSPNTILIAGTASTEHLTENTRAAEIVLDDDTLKALDAA